MVLYSFSSKTTDVFVKADDVLVSSFMHTLAPVDSELGILFDVTRIGNTTQEEKTSIHSTSRLVYAREFSYMPSVLLPILLIKLETRFSIHATIHELESKLFCVLSLVTIGTNL